MEMQGKKRSRRLNRVAIIVALGAAGAWAALRAEARRLGRGGVRLL